MGTVLQMTFCEFALARQARIVADRINGGAKLSDHEKDIYRALLRQVRIMAHIDPVDPKLMEPLERAEQIIEQSVKAASV